MKMKKIKNHNNYRRTFYVVQFIDLPFERIDDYVCVPYSWLVCIATDQKAVVTYPKDEDPFITRYRVNRKEIPNEKWRFYMALVKYRSDSYEDAENWIATRNDYRPLVEEELKTTDTEPKFPLNKKLRVANRNRSSKLNDNPRKPLPRTSIKRPAPPEPNKQLDWKRMKLDDAAQSSSAVVTDANAEPGSSGQEQSITAQNNQPMESAQTETTASNFHDPSSSSQQEDKNPQESLPIQEQQELSMPSIDIDTPILVIDDHEEVQLTSLKEQQVPSNQAILQFTEQPEPIREPQIPVALAIEMTSSNQGSRMDDVLNNGPTCHHLLNSSKISAQLYSQMKQARHLIPTQKPVVRKMRPVNIARNYNTNVNENHLSESDNTLQTDEWMKEETSSAHHGAYSDSDSVTDHEVTSDHEISADEAPIERTNKFYGTGITFRSNCADRSIAAQNSTNYQMHSKVVLEQQMLDNFATLFTKMGSTLRCTTDMFNTLRSSILDTLRTYKKLLSAVKQFNSMQNSAGNVSFSINLKPEVRHSPEERHTKITANTSSNTQDQHTRSNDDANKPPKKKHKWRFVLPPEYDPNDTKWTLKYRTNLPGLVQLMPQSGVYVNYFDFKYCQLVSKDCKSLAVRLLTEVFNRKALSVCLSMTERAQAADNVGSNARPELDELACTVLLNFILEHGLQRGWNTDLEPILSTLHSRIQEIRFRYGVLVEC